jgi:small neutral amino acid transporter SnatA (MarC family)
MKKTLRRINLFLSHIFIAFSLAFFVFIVFFAPNIVKNIGEMGMYVVSGITGILLVFGLALKKSLKNG